MNVLNIKKRLENTYCIGFNVEGSDGEFVITLKDSCEDKFSISVDNSDSVRLTALVEIETYGASFLHLINNSSMQKRTNFINLCKSNNCEVSIFINNLEISFDDFLKSSFSWNNFSVRLEKFPFNEKEDDFISYVESLIGMMLSLVDYEIIGAEEGKIIDFSSIKYERNPINRKICLAYKGYKCVCCGFDFEEKYGNAGKEYIEVHHIIPVSKMGPNYIVNPLNDLVPVCSNCHSIIHRRKEPYSVDEVKNMISKK